MEPRHWDGASVDPSVRSRLKRLDRRLRLTFSPYALNTLTGNPIEMDGWDTEQGVRLYGALVSPAFHLWRREGVTTHHVHVKEYPIAEGGFGHWQVLCLESDLARFHSPDEVWRRVKARADKTEANKTAAHKQYLRDKVLANKKLAMDIVEGRTHGVREARTFSYSGQGSRLSGAERVIERDNREMGVEE